MTMTMVAALFIFSSLLCGVESFSATSVALSPNSRIGSDQRNGAAARRSLNSIPQSHLTNIHGALFSTSSDSDSSTAEAERLRQKAIQLRAEADAAERQISPTRTSRQAALLEQEEAAVEYFDLKDSCWELSYRFANEPESKDDGIQQLRKFYSGKVQLQFRSDGYTTNLSTKSSNAATTTEQQAIFNKVWGWDLEISDQDSLNYILFSADITLPTGTERFYFQARVDGDATKGEALSLQDGSVTVKRDISAPSGGWWGIFRGADGILAQFRQLGEFRCRPIAKP